AEDGIRDFHVTGVQTCALPIWPEPLRSSNHNEKGRPCGAPFPYRFGGAYSATSSATRCANILKPRCTSVQVAAYCASLMSVSSRSEERRVGKEGTRCAAPQSRN